MLCICNCIGCMSIGAMCSVSNMDSMILSDFRAFYRILKDQYDR